MSLYTNGNYSSRRVYCVICNGKLSQEGYETLEKAMSFVANRSDNPIQSQFQNLVWTSSESGNVYVIQDVKVV